MSTIYIAGPMTGLPELNFPAFHACARNLRAIGHQVINPAEINTDHSLSWEACMRKDIAALVTCDAIHLLPGWQDSKGATLEHHIAERLGLAISFAPVPVSEYQRLRGEAKVMRELLARCRHLVLEVMDDNNYDDGEVVTNLSELEDKITLAIRGAA
jgi:hypothetical protein